MGKDEIHVMSRAQWTKLAPEVGIAVYRAFSPAQKKSFWETKFDEVLTLKWSTEERNHILKVIKFIKLHPDLFSSKTLTGKEEDELVLFFYKWSKFAEKKLGWDKKTIFSIVLTGAPVLDCKGSIYNPSPKITPSYSLALSSETSEHENCNCHLNNPLACFPDTSVTCEDNTCEEVDKGCGWLLMQSCNGVCD